MIRIVVSGGWGPVPRNAYETRLPLPVGVIA
jgi:hypothetical protein